jgi:hypothetical protein
MKAVPVEVAVARAKAERRWINEMLEMMEADEKRDDTADEIEGCRQRLAELNDFIARHSRDN